MRRALGNTGMSVNAVGLGAMPLSIQGRPDERVGLAVVQAFVETGGNFIDTAISYCLDSDDLGHNERLIARSLAALGRPNVVVATKGGLTRPRGRWEVDGRPEWLRQCCERSLRDLGGEPLRLYYLHAVDPAVPFADSLGALLRLKEEGKILHIGLSNVSGRHLEEALRMTSIAAVQNRCNVYERKDVASGLLERCRRESIAYVAYSPVGGHFGHRRLAADATLARIATKHATSPYVIALAWLLAQGEHVLPIPGASKVASTRSSAGAAGVVLDATDCAALDALAA